MIFRDPSLESRQPKIVRKTFHPRRQLIINPSGNGSEGIEEVDGGAEGIEETDSGGGGAIDELMYEMEEMVSGEHSNEDENLTVRDTPPLWKGHAPSMEAILRV